MDLEIDVYLALMFGEDQDENGEEGKGEGGEESED